MKLTTTVLVSALVLTGAAAARAQDASGRWDVSVSAPDGVHPAVLTLAKAGEKLTGTIAGGTTELAITGTQTGMAVTVSFTMPRDEGPMAIVLKGTQDGDSIAGTATFGGDEGGSWTAKRGAAGGSAGASAQPSGGGISGTWTFDVTTDMGSGSPTMVIQQDGEALTGTYTGQLGEAPLKGTIKGQEFSFAIDLDVQGTAVHIVYTGTLDGNTVSGKVSFGDMGGGTFKGTRK